MKIMLAIDGSKFSDATTRTLVSQVRPEGAEVLVLQIVEPNAFSIPPEMAESYAPQQDEKLKEDFARAEKAVDRVSETLRGAGFRTNVRVVEAETRAGILDVAAEWGADLIVVGSHGHRGVQRFLLGSVAESIARNAKCSVLIVRSQ